MTIAETMIAKSAEHLDKHLRVSLYTKRILADNEFGIVCFYLTNGIRYHKLKLGIDRHLLIRYAQVAIEGWMFHTSCYVTYSHLCSAWINTDDSHFPSQGFLTSSDTGGWRSECTRSQTLPVSIILNSSSLSS